MSAAIADVTSYWAIMRAYPWSCLTIGGIEMAVPLDGPQRFVPVFESREQAVHWAGSDEHVVELQAINNQEQS